MAGTPKPGTPRGLQQPDKSPVRITVPEGRKVRYGDPFFPKVPFQAIFYICAIFAVLIFLALTNPAPLEEPADPLNHALIDPRPEWYFMFLLQLLKYFQGPLIPIGTVVIPTLLVLLLLLLPFYDRNWARKAARRPVGVASMSAGMIIIMFLMWGGLGFPKPNFSTTSSIATGGTISPDVAAIFTAHCETCHLGGVVSGGVNLTSFSTLMSSTPASGGSVIAPGDHKSSTLWKVLQPGSGQPGGSRMPLGGPYLSDAQIGTIAGWIDGLGKGGTSTSTTSSTSTTTTTSVASSTSSTSSTSTTSNTSSTSAAGGAAGGAQVSFKNDIDTIFTAHCSACHLNGVKLGGLELTYAGIQKGGSEFSGSIVKPGDHANSLLWKKVQPNAPWPGNSRMP
ncbi:MAG: hypothetical protein ACRDG4_09170, partial [Chloroflexota bacterium]